MLPELTVIIPSFNEAARIGITVDSIRQFFAARQQTVEIIVVDDGSADATTTQAQAAGARVIRLTNNQGKGAAVATGMAAVGTEWALFTDADLATPLDALDQLLAHQATADIIIASRTAPGATVSRSQAWYRRAAGLFGNYWMRLILGLPYADTQCGFKLFNRAGRQVFTRRWISGFGFDAELLTAARRRGLRVAEVGVAWAHGASSTVRWFHYPRALWDILRIKYHDILGHYGR